jgi:hypothetical protein
MINFNIYTIIRVLFYYTGVIMDQKQLMWNVQDQIDDLTFLDSAPKGYTTFLTKFLKKVILASNNKLERDIYDTICPLTTMDEIRIAPLHMDIISYLCHIMKLDGKTIEKRYLSSLNTEMFDIFNALENNHSVTDLVFLESIGSDYPLLNKAFSVEGSKDHFITTLMIHKWMFNRTTFNVTTSLSTELFNTDIGKNCPLEYLKLPYDSFYVNFNNYTFEHSGIKTRLVGMHICEPNIQNSSIDVKWEIMIHTLTENNKVVFYPLFLDFNENSNKTVDQIIEDNYNKFLNDSDNANEITKFTSNVIFETKEIFTHFVKVLLYINSVGFERNFLLNKELLKKEIRKNKKNKGKTQSLKKELLNLSNYIVLDTTEHKPLSEHNESSIKKSVHWRRGHWKVQRYGEKLKQSKLQWRKPKLINKNELENNDKNTQTSKEYIVKN